MPHVIPSLWFDSEALEAAEYYVSVFPNSRIERVTRYQEGGPRPAGSVLTVDFTLDGTRHNALNGGPEFHFNEAVSLVVECADQAEVDHYWDALSLGGSEGPCGWLKDRWGLSWQIVPLPFLDLVAGPDQERAGRAMAAMMKMGKLDLATLMAAADGDGQ
ncbi:VOC family protein [Streptomyces sp. NPDC004959]|uniref:VOC family protein n=1 Tax=unclassified Streptomyces TaxID=2593676 RepID=UPI0004C93C0F|nr:VOC family protein [Streptomyces sp. NRRL F-5630]